MATQEEVLQKVNEYCTEKQYTLNDDFRSKFSEKFANANTEAKVDDENVFSSIKFNLDTAFSAVSKEIKVKDDSWKTKETEYLNQIETLKKNQKVVEPSKKTEVKIELPEDIKEQLNELSKFKNNQQKHEKLANALNLAKKNVREDLHSELESVLNIMSVDYDKSEAEIADTLSKTFAKLYKNKIGDVRPQAASSNAKKDEELFKGMKPIAI